MKNPKVTILIPHYKTLELTKLCLYLLKKNTDLTQAHVLVIDNGSQDESTEYLKTVDWIELFIRDISNDADLVLSHANALQEGLLRIKTPYVLLFHTDTLVTDPNWLDQLLAPIEGEPQVAGVGAWKLNPRPWYEKWLHEAGDAIKLAIARAQGKQCPKIYGTADNPYYLRSHCALYRTELLKQHNLEFHAGQTVGKAMHHRLLALGYKLIVLPDKKLLPYLVHAEHATQALNAHEERMDFDLSSRNTKRCIKRLKKLLKSVKADEILKDGTLGL